ncbi:MAG: hypothetical protein JW938_05680 [Candidatus Omnitrophica bacterium]|nr:hypothetical protein [Candidatus Omnitrophota bacterium]
MKSFEDDPYLNHNIDGTSTAATTSYDDDEGAAEGADFIVLYTSLMLLLLSFFIVLFSMASTSTGKFSSARDSLKNEFSTMGLNTAKKSLVFMYSFMKIKSSFNPVMHPYLEEEERPDDIVAKRRKEITRVYWEEEESVDVSAKMGDLILLGVNAERQRNDLLLRIPSSKLFYPGQTTLAPAGKFLIINMLNIIRSDFEKIAIHSFNDESESESDPFAKDSYIISTERAFAVAQVIADQLDMPLKNFPYYGYGKYRSNDPTSKLEANIFNNRVELWIRELWTTKEEITDIASENVAGTGDPVTPAIPQ